MWLTRFAIKNWVVTAMFFIGLAVFGVYSYLQLGKNLFPNIDFPYVFVQASYPGASPSEMEKLVVKPIEDQLNGMENLERLSANAQEGTAIVVARFKMDTDANYEVMDVQRRVETARIYMPSDMDPPYVDKFSTNSDPVLEEAVSSSRLTASQLSDVVNQRLVTDLRAVPGVLSVNAAGSTPREIHVFPDQIRLMAAGATLNDINNALAYNNANLPGGRMDSPTSETTVSIHADIIQPQDILGIPLPVPNGANKFLTIGKVAQVEDGHEEQRLPSDYNGASSILLQVNRQSDADTVQTTKVVRAEFATLTKQFPAIKFSEIDAASDYTNASINGVLQSLGEGILLTALVMFLFLHAWRNAIVVLIAIPSSLLATFVVMRVMGFTVDIISLMGLGLTIGILVDDSIVVLENITRHRDLGEAPLDAAYTGRTEIGKAAITITLVDVVVFLPIAFMTGIIGKYLKEFGLVIVVATLFSLLVSFTLTPLLAGRWSVKRRAAGIPGWARWFQNLYDRLAQFYHAKALPWALAHRVLVPSVCGLFVIYSFTLLGGLPEVARWAPLAISVTVVALPMLLILGISWLLVRIKWVRTTAPAPAHGGNLLKRLGRFCGTLFASTARATLYRWKVILLTAGIALAIALPFLPLARIQSEFVPSSSTGVLTGSISYHVGTPMATTQAGMAQLEKELLKIPYVSAVLATVGAKPSGFSELQGGSYAEFNVVLDKNHRRDTEIVLAKARKLGWTVPGAEYQIATEGGGGSGSEIYYAIKGPDALLNGAAEKLAALIRQQPGAINVSTSAETQAPRLNVQIDPRRAEMLGVAPGDAALATRIAIGGAIPTKVRLDSGLTNVRLEFDYRDRNDLQRVEEVRVRAADGTLVPLSSVASFTITTAPTKIERQDRQRYVRVFGDIDHSTNTALGSVLAPVNAAIATPGYFPPGVTASSDDGDSQLFMQMMANMGLALAISFLLVYMLMVVLYGSFLEPFIVMFSVPLAIVGALGGLALRHQTINLFSLIAMIMLFGLVAKNGILLVDYANQQRKKGMEVVPAMITAAEIRFRPIVMTTCAMIFGMLPLSLGLTEGAEERASMGTVLIGGLASSLVLTLVLVPIMYTWIMGAVDARERRRAARYALEREHEMPEFEHVPQFGVGST